MTGRLSVLGSIIAALILLIAATVTQLSILNYAAMAVLLASAALLLWRQHEEET
jgi:hypothetical protein